MRKTALSFLALGIVLLAIFFYPQFVEKPVKNGEGPLALTIDASLPAPEYHSPLDTWRINHADIVTRGDIIQSDCLQCHAPETSCNNCHRYVGAAEIVP